MDSENNCGCGKDCDKDSQNKESSITMARPAIKNKFEYLKDADVQRSLLDSTNNNISAVTFFIQDIRCASCIGVLEKLYKFMPGIIDSKVELLQKKIHISFDNSKTSLKEIVELLSSMGYEPTINLDNNESARKKNNSDLKKLYTKIGVAGFCLGNIMLLSFPEYLSLDNGQDHNLKNVFNYLNILLSLPVFFYCSSGYFISAWKALRKKIVNIDLPISIGLTALFIRSLYEIMVFGNAGFIDSLAGLVFLLLLGKLFQSKTYDSLNYERDYKSYFPISVTLVLENKVESIPVTKLRIGDRILIHSNEVVPVDSILFAGNSSVDYSFVTGESFPEQKVPGEIIYAGGKHSGGAIELEVLRTVSRSHFTQLWNNKAFEKKCDAGFSELTNNFSKYFTFAVLAIAIGSALYWLPRDFYMAIDTFTTVLIVACPCALALTTPFALGNALRIFGRNKLFLKNAAVVESISKIDTIVFDKTGTITDSKEIDLRFIGSMLNRRDLSLIKSLVRNSSHPLSKKIYDSIDAKIFDVEDFLESVSEGVSGKINGIEVRMGTLRFLLKDVDCSFYLRHEISRNSFSSNVYVLLDHHIKGYFSFNNKYRDGFKEMIEELSDDYSLSLLSGDNSNEKTNLHKFFKDENLFFNKTPPEKLLYIKKLQSDGRNVMMIGDGLNDAGALKQSNVGIAVSDDITNFSPSCDAIFEASGFSKLNGLIKFSKTTMSIIKVSFAASFLYNVIGLYLAAQGTFSPLIAAILMPFNSISIILFVTAATNFFAKRRKLL